MHADKRPTENQTAYKSTKPDILSQLVSFSVHESHDREEQNRTVSEHERGDALSWAESCIVNYNADTAQQPHTRDRHCNRYEHVNRRFLAGQGDIRKIVGGNAADEHKVMNIKGSAKRA